MWWDSDKALFIRPVLIPFKRLGGLYVLRNRNPEGSAPESQTCAGRVCPGINVKNCGREGCPLKGCEEHLVLDEVH